MSVNMKTAILFLIATAASASLCLAQLTQVGYPEEAGLTPRTGTIDVNTNSNNHDLETGDISITSNTNVVLAWEDDDGGIFDFEACWTLYNANGTLLTPPVTITNIVGTPCFAGAEELTNMTYRSFFRSDGSPTPHYTGDFGGKAKANLFGNGFAFCAGCDAIACEIPELFAINNDNLGTEFNGSPVVQLLNNDGSRNAAAGGPDVAGILSFSDADVEYDGSVRPGDIDYLSNGNILIVGESRQVEDRLLTGQTAGNVVVYKILSPTGAVIKGYSAASSEASGQDMWHGAGVTANGFALRFNVGSTRIRFFDNDGNPQGPNINLAAVTGHAEAGAGGRGDGSGFKGNGNDAVVYVATSASGPWVTVLNANGTVRYSRAVTGTNDLGAYANSDRLDAAISADGRVIVAFDAGNNDTNNVNLFRLPQARLFDPCGNPIGPVFYLSERETATNAIAANDGRGRPRVAFRGNTIAAMWGSLNSPADVGRVLALRIFDVAPCNLTPCSSTAMGMTTVVTDKALWYNTANYYTNGFINPAAEAVNLSNWEPYSSVLGNSTFLIEANTFADDGTLANQRFAVTFQPVGGGAAKIGDAFYTDAGAAYRGAINGSRQNGNPGRVAGDKRPGAVNFIAGGEASADGVVAFQSDARWNAGTASGMYNAVNRYGTVQTFSLNTATLVQTPLHKAFDAVNGRQTAAYAGNAGEVSRFGGGLTVLDNGNSVVLIDDRTLYSSPNRTATFAIISPTGTVVKDTIAIDPSIANTPWDNIIAYRGGFCIRFNATLYFYDNAGTLQGSSPQSTSGIGFDGGRGDGTRIQSHINSPYVYLAGAVVESGNRLVRIAAWDSRSRAFIGQTAVTTCYTNANATDRVNLAVDACDRICVAYEIRPNFDDFTLLQVSARVLQFNGFNNTFAFLTGEFFPFVNQDRVGGLGIQTILTQRPTVAMTTKEICIAAKASMNSTNNPSAGADSTAETTLYTVISHPAALPDPTPPVLSIAQSGNNVVVSWALNTCDYRVQTAASVNGPYTDMNPQPGVVISGNSKSVSIPAGGNSLFVRLRRN